MAHPISIHFQPPAITTELFIGKDLLLTNFFYELCKKFGQKFVIITDETVKCLYGTKLSNLLSADMIEVPQGEKAKTREIKKNVEDYLLKNGYGKEALLIALGGGSIMDLSGFIASTYLRGVSLLLIPTTLLAMVDAAIGGKTAVDTALGKNLIGTFYHPKAIISDVNLLNSLTEKEMVNGLAEIIKIGLIWDKEILKLKIAENSLEEIIKKAAEAKIAIISKDPFDKGLRHILNFGHTIAHALETVTNFTIAHGEAVAIGTVIESYLSFYLGFLQKHEFLEIEELYLSTFKALKLPKLYKRDAVMQALQFDKKRVSEGLRFILIDKIGHAISFNGNYCRIVENESILQALCYMEKIYG